MDLTDELMDQIREDLDDILEDGGYGFTHPEGQPNVILRFLRRVTGRQRDACEQLLQQYGVRYEIED